MNLIGIAAMTKDGCIGKDNTIPWHHKEDFKHFRRLTLDSTVIMGRKTWDSLPKKPLEKRNNVILTRQISEIRQDGESTYFTPLDKLSALLMKLREPHYVIGGAEIWNILWDHINMFHMTIVDDVVEGGDTFISPKFFKDFKSVNSIPLSEHCIAHKYVRER